MVIVSFSHHDLDGVGCTALMKQVHPDAICFNVGYGDVYEAIKMFMEGRDKVDVMYVTDLCLEKDCIELLDDYYKQDRIVELYLIDHHASTRRFEAYPWVKVNTDFCATKLVAQFFDVVNRDNEPFVEAVDAYDRWQLNSPFRKAGEDLNTLFNVIREQRFLNRFIYDLDIALHPTEQMAVEREIRRVNEYVNDIVEHGKMFDSAPIKFFMTMGDVEQASVIGHVALERNTEAEFTLNIDQRYGKGSLRSNGFDVSKIAEMFGGGGHPRAAGFQLDAKNLATALPDALNKIREFLSS